AIEEVKGISKQLHKINMLIIEDNQTVLGSSLDLPKEKLTFPKLTKGKSDIITREFRGDPVRIDYQYFPFWNWHIVSFISEKAYMAPIQLAKKIVYSGTFGVLIFVLFTLFLVFNFFVNLPLKRVIRATEGVAEGKFSKVDVRRKDEIGQLVHSFNSMVDSLNKKNVEVTNLIEAIRVSEAQYRGIFDSATDSFLIFDFDGNIVEVNPQACKMYGYPYEELLKLSGKEIVDPDYHHLFEQFKRDVQTTGEFHAESVNVRKDGATFNTEVKGNKFDYKGKPHLLAVIRDTTDRKRAEEEKEKLQAQLQRAQKMEVIGTLAGGVAHDLNNILSGLVSYP
ncbi:unnamed protein product, partial [marine sediment metagenome]